MRTHSENCGSFFVIEKLRSVEICDKFELRNMKWWNQMFKEINKENAFQDILNQIIENIQNGTLKSGDALPAERTLAEEMGVSRPVVREVLRALELLGVINSVRGGANYISKDLEHCLIGPLSILFRLNNSSVLEAQQLRAALECKAAALAAVP